MQTVIPQGLSDITIIGQDLELHFVIFGTYDVELFFCTYDLFSIMGCVEHFEYISPHLSIKAFQMMIKSCKL